MAWMLANVLQLAEDGKPCILWYRGEKHEEKLPTENDDQVRGDLTAGTCVLLEGVPGAWTHVLVLRQCQHWGDTYPSVGELRKQAKPQPAQPLPHLSSHGSWLIDDEGRPCEKGAAKAFDVLNYAGWRLSELQGVMCTFWRCDLDGRVVMVLPPIGIPDEWQPRSDSEMPDTFEPVIRTRGSFGPVEPRGELHVPVTMRLKPKSKAGASRPPDVQPSLIDVHFSIRELFFFDKAIEAYVRGVGQVRIPAPEAREVYEAVKEQLDARIPNGVRIHGMSRAGGVHDLVVEGLEPLASMFEEIDPGAYLARRLSDNDVLDLNRLLEHMPGVRNRDPKKSLDIPELGLDKRKEAFRSLFGLWNGNDEIKLLPRSALLVPVAATDRGPTWWVWETIKEGYATYLFRPAENALQSLIDWLRQPDPSRQELLNDSALQNELGYVDRVIHLDGEDSLAQWWRDLRTLLGR